MTGETQKAKSQKRRESEEVGGLHYLTNSIGMKLVLIHPGTFTMGSPEGEAGRKDDEGQHEVTLTKSFFLGINPVTQEQYMRVMGENPSHFQGNRGLDRPVDRVSWGDAVDFCKRLSRLADEKKAGCVYRLPTEAEWEYSCRAGSELSFCFGESSKSLMSYAWCVSNSRGKTHPVGRKKSNGWSLYDMHGNVWEWCLDWYGPYPKRAETDPVGPKRGSSRVLRGGGWGSFLNCCRSAQRYRFDPTYRTGSFGFRVVLSSLGNCA
jgi:formylglycine-generating enzyme required for sulfatase activity